MANSNLGLGEGIKARVQQTRTANTLGERVAKCRAMYIQHKRTTLEQARDIGKELVAVREGCMAEGRSNFGETLVEIGIPRSTANNYIRIAENWILVESLLSTRGQIPLSEVLTLLPGSDAEPSPAVPTANGHAAPPVPDKDGKIWERPTFEHTTTRPPPVRKPREPGDDTQYERLAAEDARNTPKNGEAMFDWKEWNKDFGRVVRHLDVLGNAYGAKESPQVEGLRRQLSEFLKNFKGTYKYLAKQQAP